MTTDSTAGTTNAPGPSGSIRRILLATDLAAASEGAALEALYLANDLRAQLLIVSVIDPGSLRLPGNRSALRVDQVRIAREAAAQDLVSRGRAMGVRVNFLIWEGDAGESIVEAARSEQVDLVVVGSHGRGSVGRFFIGSVSDYVVRHATCPVLVVPARNYVPAEAVASPR